jgi:MFS family permease
LVTGLLAFTLFNSSDIFLLLKAKQAGLEDTEIIGVYIFYNLVYALAAFPMGIIADKIGLKKVFLSGLALFAVAYLAMSISTGIYAIGAIFFLYGIYAASTEGISKAWITNISDRKDTATAIGTYTGFQSVFTMIASALAGLIWNQFGAAATFAVTGFATILVILYFLIVFRGNSRFAGQ